MLVQCHVDVVDGFMGTDDRVPQEALVKKYVTLLGENEGQDEVRYLHGNLDGEPSLSSAATTRKTTST